MSCAGTEKGGEKRLDKANFTKRDDDADGTNRFFLTFFWKKHIWIS